MGYLLKILRIGISTFIPFVLLAKIGNTYIPYQDNAVTYVNEFTFYDLRILFSHIMPIFYVAAFILQALVVIPLWDKFSNKLATAAIAFFVVIGIIIAVSVGMGYAVWDRSVGFSSLYRSMYVLTIIQSLYWLFNFFTLYLLGIVYYKKHMQVSVSKSTV